MLDSRMRQHQEFRVHHNITKKQYIEIDRSWRFHVLARSTQQILDPKQPSHHLRRANIANSNFGGHVKKGSF